MHRLEQAVSRSNTAGIKHSRRLARDGTRWPNFAIEFTPKPTWLWPFPSSTAGFGESKLGVEFNDYAYQQRTEPDGYLISCQTGVHPAPKGYPQYDSVAGLVGLPDRTP